MNKRYLYVREKVFCKKTLQWPFLRLGIHFTIFFFHRKPPTTSLQLLLGRWGFAKKNCSTLPGLNGNDAKSRCLRIVPAWAAGPSNMTQVRSEPCRCVGPSTTCRRRFVPSTHQVRCAWQTADLVATPNIYIYGKNLPKKTIHQQPIIYLGQLFSNKCLVLIPILSCKYLGIKLDK